MKEKSTPEVQELKELMLKLNREELEELRTRLEELLRQKRQERGL